MRPVIGQCASGPSGVARLQGLVGASAIVCNVGVNAAGDRAIWAVGRGHAIADRLRAGRSHIVWGLLCLRGCEHKCKYSLLQFDASRAASDS